MNSSRILTISAIVVVFVLPTAQATLQPVLDDPTGDIRWGIHGMEFPHSLDPVRESRTHNGSAADVEEIRVGDNQTHVVLELDLGTLPPDASECAGPPGASSILDCSYIYEFAWAYYRESDSWAEMMSGYWFVGCPNAQVECGDLISFQTWSGASPYIDFERIEPDILRLTVDKAVMTEGGDPAEERAAPCDGLFLNFDFSARASMREGSGYVDERDTAETGVYALRHQPEHCANDAVGGSASKPGNALAVLSAAGVPSLAVAALVGILWAMGRRRGGEGRW